MRVAIPLFGTRVSPRFDCAREFVVVDAVGGEAGQRQNLAAAGWTPLDRIRKLVELGVETVICGGIDRFTMQQLAFHNINLFPWITGEAEDALNCLLKGELQAGFMMGAGGRCRGRWRFRGRRGFCGPNWADC